MISIFAINFILPKINLLPQKHQIPGSQTSTSETLFNITPKIVTFSFKTQITSNLLLSHSQSKSGVGVSRGGFPLDSVIPLPTAGRWRFARGRALVLL